MDWKLANTAPINERVRVANILDESSMKEDSYFKTTGVYDGEKWVCSAAFMCTDGRLRWNPTHWMPIHPKHSDIAGDTDE